MKYAILSDNTFVMRLDRGDDVHQSVESLCAQESIGNASVQGIGSLESPLLAHYSMETKQFTDKPFEGIYEISSLLGNVALVDGQPFAHLHVNLSGPDMHTFGGHFVKGACSATVELIITGFPSIHTKSHDEAIGLKTWDLDRN